MRTVERNKIFEMEFESERDYGDPFNEIEMDVVFKESGKSKIKIPAFWAGKNTWKVRYSSDIPGKKEYETYCSDMSNKSLNGIKGELEVVDYNGENALYKHGRIKVSENSRYLIHNDNKPFFWLADTWWYCLTKRCKFHENFKILAEDRIKKGFTVIQLIAGLYYHNEEFDKGGENEAGWPWDKGFTTINPDYFDFADKKIFFLVESGLVPCIVGNWGFHLHRRGIDKIKKHWRYIISRWGSLPVVWCVAGEGRLPYVFEGIKDVYNETLMDEIRTELVEGGQEVSRYIKKIDQFNNLRTVHPCPAWIIDETYSSRGVFYDPDTYDIDWLQTGHFGRNLMEHTISTCRRSLIAKPTKPVINGEPVYEGICGGSWQDVIRFVFWTHMLSGTAGHSYSAPGIFSMFGKEDIKDPFGVNRCNKEWGEATWEESYTYPGSFQIGLGKKILERFEWQRFGHHRDWVSPCWDAENRLLCYASGIPSKVRIIYIPSITYCNTPAAHKDLKILNIEEGVNYKAYYISPRTGRKLDEMEVKPDSRGIWEVPGKSTLTKLPTLEDWLLILEAE